MTISVNKSYKKNNETIEHQGLDALTILYIPCIIIIIIKILIVLKVQHSYKVHSSNISI